MHETPSRVGRSVRKRCEAGRYASRKMLRRPTTGRAGLNGGAPRSTTVSRSSIFPGCGAVFEANGRLGTVLPGLPGPVLVFLGLLVGAWADGFANVGLGTLLLLALLTVAAYA